jgi:hypothetical protein
VENILLFLGSNWPSPRKKPAPSGSECLRNRTLFSVYLESPSFYTARVKLRRTQPEHLSSELPPRADIGCHKPICLRLEIRVRRRCIAQESAYIEFMFEMLFLLEEA